MTDAQDPAEAAASLLTLMDATANMAATLTGIKQQLVDLGWSQASAELLVVEIMKQQSTASLK